MNKVTTPVNHNDPLYSMRCNLGTQSKPFYSYVELGKFSNQYDAEKEMIERLKNCSTLLHWQMFKDERLSNTQSTTYQEDTIYSHMSDLPKTGFKVLIKINGDSDTDIMSMLDEIKNKVEDGYTLALEHRPSGDYHFDKFGEEALNDEGE